ncbi:Uncharacterised protein [BD1-7 clade bacterium]|uniref:3-oxo-5-alpha-steroid 4-dehydrogenase C-terminal domain-containing protein n=1 Tax=BD1-7 clade bacterium TaxID=2029982 RepID=A0A5S9P979_9GAMM|nr:Uncharacterised protein [BD1-7 clade bacterium]CAA0101241.1 Uncharacterised protein [BD1-7 clade bacterium]
MDYSTPFIVTLSILAACSVFWIIGKFLPIESPVVYGRHDTGNNRVGIPTRLSWVIMESPAALVFAWFLFNGELPVSAPMIALFVMWELHYIHRAFIYPLQLKVRPGSTTPIRMTLSGAIVCTVTGYTNGAYISDYADYLQSNSWFYSPEFIIGTLIYIVGFVLNKTSDAELMRLRKENPNAYSIPRKGAYRWISCPNYLGELLTWVGFACAAWSIAGVVFAAMSASNLIFRAIENHRWYHEKFPDYPADRKAVIPFLL